MKKLRPRESPQGVIWRLPSLVKARLRVRRVKEESEKAGLKLSIKKTKIMGSGPNTS